MIHYIFINYNHPIHHSLAAAGVLIAVLRTLVLCVASDVTPFDETNNTFHRSRSSNNKYNTSIFQCHDTILSDETIGPNFGNVSAATTRIESIATLSDREYAVLSYYGKMALPRINNSDDFNDTLFMNIGPPTNPMLNSRSDVRRVVNRYISRIMLGCYNNSDLDNIFLSDTTRPYAEAGTAVFSEYCFRDGDYEFSTIELIQLLYVSRQYPGSMPDNVFGAIRDKLLSINGTITTQDFDLPCRIKLGPIRYDFTANIEFQPENHILQIEISRYLSNQILVEKYPDKVEFDNIKNGNANWLMEYLSTFLNKYFYEYNSRPYQGIIVKAISVLHSYALDTNIQMISEMILDMISSFSAIQMNRLRRYVPFRRQPQYIDDSQSYPGESELFRMAVLVGDYGVVASKGNNAVPNTGENGGRFADLVLLNTVASKYRLKDFILDNFFRGRTNDSTTVSILEYEYFVSSHDTVEMYYSTPNVLISAGGTTTNSIPPKVSFPYRVCLFKSCPFQGLFLNAINKIIFGEIDKGERGWARPTTIVPSSETSTDILDMVHYNGGKKSVIGKFTQPFRRNLCVAPNFACGLQLEYGNIIEPMMDPCSIVVGDWRFFDLSGNRNTICPKYGYYMAVYSRQCLSQCEDQADNYGLLEIFESINSITFAMFQQNVLLNNPNPFTVRGIQIYKPMNDKIITFEIFPVNGDQSQILQVEGIDGSATGNDANAATRDFNPKYRNWPLAWSANGSIQSTSMKGRWTYDSNITKERFIYDVTNPLQPIRIVSTLPMLIKHSASSNKSEGRIHGQYFDDSSNVIANDTIQSLSFTWNAFSGYITGFRTDWRASGLYAIHGTMKEESTILHRVRHIPFNLNETIVAIGIRENVYYSTSRVNSIRIVTNENRTFIVGNTYQDTITNNVEIVYYAPNIIAFYGHVSDSMIYQLRVVSIS